MSERRGDNSVEKRSADKRRTAAIGSYTPPILAKRERLSQVTAADSKTSGVPA